MPDGISLIPSISVVTLYVAYGLTVIRSEITRCSCAFGISIERTLSFISKLGASIITLPWASFSATHFAYTVVFSVTVSAEKFHLVVKSASLYQPTKIYPAFVGFVGALATLPYKIDWLATSLPPIELKVRS